MSCLACLVLVFLSADPDAGCKQLFDPDMFDSLEEDTASEDSGSGSPTAVYHPPTPVPEVTTPVAGTVWTHGQTGVEVWWEGLSGAFFKVELYRGGEFVARLDDAWIEGGTSFQFPDSVPSTWGSGEGFTIVVTNSFNESITSEAFRIESEIGVSLPNRHSYWSQGLTGLPIAWSGAQGDEVTCDLYREDEWIAEVVHDAPNSGLFTFEAPLPASWGSGSGYRLLINDAYGNEGWSEEFAIGGILVGPMSGTDNGSQAVSWIGGHTVVTVRLCCGVQPIADLSGAIDNTGQFDLGTSLDPYRGGYSEPCRLLVTDDLYDYGWSEPIDMLPEMPVNEGPEPGMRFVSIPSGQFVMGSPEGEAGRGSDEEQHGVTITAFEMMTTEVTQAVWDDVMMYSWAGRYERDRGEGDDYPVYYVSWEDCRAFIDELNEREDGYIYRLPSEAEWEYACRAGTSSTFFWGETPSGTAAASHAWMNFNSSNSTHPVASKEPNPWGLYDMCGNVGEWCEDIYHAGYAGAPTDGSAWTDGGGDARICRGGSWMDGAANCRSANRSYSEPDSHRFSVGFRLVRTPSAVVVEAEASSRMDTF